MISNYVHVTPFEVISQILYAIFSVSYYILNLYSYLPMLQAIFTNISLYLLIPTAGLGPPLIEEVSITEDGIQRVYFLKFPDSCNQ